MKSTRPLVVVARRDNADSLLTLMRGSYTPEFQLVLVSKSFSARAAAAVPSRSCTRRSGDLPYGF